MISVVLVEDHPSMRRVLRQYLAMASDMQLLGEGATGPEAVALTLELQPDVLLLDVALPGFQGDEVVRRLQKVRFKGRVLAVSSHHTSQVVQCVMASGTAGYLVKDDIYLYLFEAIRFLMAHPEATWLSPMLTQKMT